MKKKTAFGIVVALRTRVLFAKRSVIMPGFGVQFFYIAGHGKLFIADVDGMSASNEIPHVLFCKAAFRVPIRFVEVLCEDVTGAYWCVYTLAKDRRIRSAWRDDPLLQTRLLSRQSCFFHARPAS